MNEFDPVAVFNAGAAEGPGSRPGIAALLGPRFDQPRGEPAAKTLIVCAAPRTGSYELARLLTAAGIGVAHEYFNPTCAAALAARWNLPGNMLDDSELGRYIDELRRRRSPGGVCAVKLQYWQYEDTLRNAHGRALFAGAVVVHLFRADVVGQFASWHRACESGRFDFTEKITHPPRDPADLHRAGGLLPMLDQLVNDDANFRRLFVCAAIRPIFCEFNELARDPRAIVSAIAAALEVTVDRARLDAAIALGERYRYGEPDGARERALADVLLPLAFRK
ncbi:MAG: Stf0 family sulfotransferase [Xanthobacteraceae bacterium]